TNPGTQNLTLTCTIVGRPIIEAYFDLEMKYDGFSFWQYKVPDTFCRGQGETVINATVTFRPNLFREMT
ncbi:hypothetical protein RRG08_053103, partial [Elysia crispata]